MSLFRGMPLLISGKSVVHFVHVTKSGTKNYRHFEEGDRKAHIVKLSCITGHDKE